jgi:hypothetical protein
MFTRRLIRAGVATVLLSAIGPNGSLRAQDVQVTVTVTGVGAEAIPFRGALMFQDGGLQMVDTVTPFETKGRGTVVGLFEATVTGAEIQVHLSKGGRGSATGSAGRVVVGSELLRGVSHFARTF